MNTQLSLGPSELFGPSFGRDFTEVDPKEFTKFDQRPDPAEVRMWLQSLRITLWQSWILDERGLKLASDWFCDALDSFYTWRETNV